LLINKYFKNKYLDLRFYSPNLFDRIDAYLGSILTGGRRKSFFCDSKSPKLCAYCHLFRGILKGERKNNDLKLINMTFGSHYKGKPYKATWIIYFNYYGLFRANQIIKRLRRLSKSIS
jgi:hypothetical protein